MFPWTSVASAGKHLTNRAFCEAIETAEPGNTIAYFWPDPPLVLVERAKRRGLLTVREMINCYRGTAKKILDEAYQNLRLTPKHGITKASVEQERQELSLYDYIFSPTQVEPSLVEAGVPIKRMLTGGFGWSPARFTKKYNRSNFPGLTALFVGSFCVRKGAIQLLEAWSKSGVPGQLLIAGNIEDAIKPLIAPYLKDKSIRFLDYVQDVSLLYSMADVFVFPTFEEGDPQVTYEAAGCGLPVITTAMGAGRIIKDNVNGLIVKAGDAAALSDAIVRVASSNEYRLYLAQNAKAAAARFTFEKLGHERAVTLTAILNGSYSQKARSGAEQ